MADATPSSVITVAASPQLSRGRIIPPGARADAALKTAALAWFAMATLGQWVFLYYLIAFYGHSTLTGNFQTWTRNTFLRMSYVRGDTAGNLAFASHVLLAAVIAFGGALQLVPSIRARALGVHRWIGRAFFTTALGLSASGIYMEWVRGDRESVFSGLTITLNGALIIFFSLRAWQLARRHQPSAHRPWALRAYVVANGQWFNRVGFMAWLVLRGLLTRSERFDGVFGGFWDSVGCYLVPLAVLELYLRVRKAGSPRGRFAMAGGLAVFTLVLGAGIVGGIMILWWPLLAPAK